MTGRRAIVGLCMLCALVFSAFAAQSASATTTLFTCKKSPAKPTGEKFSGAHCKKSDTSPTGEWRHEEVPVNTTTEITGTTEDTSGNLTPSQLHSVVSGVEVELESASAHILPELGGVKSWIENRISGKEHYYFGEAWVRYTGVKVLKPAGKGCKVVGEEVTTNKLKFTSEGQGENTKFEPAAGTVFAEFTVEGCTIAALNGKYEVKGSVRGQPDGATINFSRTTTTAEKTLTLRGQVAGLASSVTVKGTDIKAGDAVDTPLSTTVVSTP